MPEATMVACLVAWSEDTSNPALSSYSVTNGIDASESGPNRPKNTIRWVFRYQTGVPCSSRIISYVPDRAAGMVTGIRYQPGTVASVAVTDKLGKSCGRHRTHHEC